MSLNLFDVPDVDYRYEASRDVAFQPALTGTRPITFSILASDDYYDLNELRFQVKVRLLSKYVYIHVFVCSITRSALLFSAMQSHNLHTVTLVVQCF